MASSYDNDLRLNEMATGDQSGAWGTVTNLNLEMIAEAFSYGTRAIANASTDNITLADGALDADRSMYLKLTGGGQACTVSLLPNTVSKVWLIENATSATLTFTQGSGANVAVLAGQVKMIATDGAGSGAVVYDLLTDVNLAGTTHFDNIDVDGTTNLDAVDIDGAVQLDATLTVGANDQGYDVTLHGDTAARNVVWDSSADSLIFSDNAKAVFGASSDLSVYHDASNSYVQDLGTGYLVLSSNGPGVRINSDSAEVMADFAPNGAVSLYHDNAVKIATTATGVEVTGAATVGGAAVKVAGKETMFVPAVAMYPSTTNPCSDVEQVETTALRPDLKVLDFAADADDFAQFAIAMPKSWNEGTVTFQPFWTVTGTNTGTVAWQLAGVAITNDESIDTAFGTQVATTALAFSGTSNDLMVSAESGAVTIAGSPAANDMCFFQINRDTSADDQTGAARLLGVKMFFTTDAANDA
tara:strand:- start:1900 stop:3312 length:1413 start_codon:yes stop_codon:yes gene_type:complete